MVCDGGLEIDNRYCSILRAIIHDRTGYTQSGWICRVDSFYFSPLLVPSPVLTPVHLDKRQAPFPLR